MKRTDAPAMIVLTLDRLAREFGVDPLDLWAWVWKEKPAPRWFVERALAAYFPGLRESDFDIDEGLSSAPNRAMFGAPMQTQSSTLHEFEGRPPTDHPFVAALRARGLTLTEWCDSHKIKRLRVKGWYTPGDGARRIPRAWANAIEKEFGKARGGKPLLPATEDTWKNGIKE